MPQSFPSYTLTTDDVEVVRTQYILDDYQESTRPETAISRFNMTAKRQFASDVLLQSLLDSVIVDQQEELEDAWTDKYNERIQRGDDTATAETQADALQLLLVFALLAVEVFTLMINDAGYRMCVMQEGATGAQALKKMEDQIADWQAFAASREGASNFVPLYRY